MKINKYIEIVASSVPQLNAIDKESQRDILKTLSRKYTKVRVTIVDDMDSLIGLVAKRPDLVILGMKLILLNPELGYDESPKVRLSDYLKDNGIEFTGSETGPLALEYDKPAAKQKVIDAGMRSAAYFVSPLKNPRFMHDLIFPLFVKPANEGDSVGIDERSLVNSQEELEAKIMSIHKECRLNALVEEYLPGREFSVGIIENSVSGETMVMPIEITSPIDVNGNVFLSQAAKNADHEKVSLVGDQTLREAVNDLAINAFKSLGARDYGRIDIRLDSFGEPNFIEANLMPGLSSHGYLARCCFMNEGISYDDMISYIVDLGFKRSDLLIRKATGTFPLATLVGPNPELVETYDS